MKNATVKREKRRKAKLYDFTDKDAGRAVFMRLRESKRGVLDWIIDILKGKG